MRQHLQTDRIGAQTPHQEAGMHQLMHRHTGRGRTALQVLGSGRGEAGSWSAAAAPAWADRARRESFRVALCAPLRGPEGIWGPSCLAAARLARDEINRWAGLAGRTCELQIVDASVEATDVQHVIADLVDGGEIDAVVGMCISSVRRPIVRELRARVPFVYTCLYEGGDRSPGLYAIGETAARQLSPSIAWLAHHRHARRWMLLGNDYVWPRVSHEIARRAIAAGGGEVVAETFVPFGGADHSQLIDTLRRTRADAVLISMVGQDAIDFNRAFASAGLQRHALRLSCAIEENLLLAIGAESTSDLYVALGYFAALETDANLDFKQRYHAQFGERAPALNSIGQSLYEGLLFLQALVAERPVPAHEGRSARGPGRQPVFGDEAPIYLAQAEGHHFRVIARF
jgi:urea transport system substrate-binding protein